MNIQYYNSFFLELEEKIFIVKGKEKKYFFILRSEPECQTNYMNCHIIQSYR